MRRRLSARRNTFLLNCLKLVRQVEGRYHGKSSIAFKLLITFILSSDLWALGCIIYRMIAGQFPFQGLSEYLTLEKIKILEYTFPEGFDEQAKDLVQKLLVCLSTTHLGANTSIIGPTFVGT